jgi:hypothetical protein
MRLRKRERKKERKREKDGKCEIVCLTKKREKERNRGNTIPSKHEI